MGTSPERHAPAFAGIVYADETGVAITNTLEATPTIVANAGFAAAHNNRDPENAAAFTVAAASGTVTVTDAGDYEVEFDIGGDLGGATQIMLAKINVDGSPLAGGNKVECTLENPDAAGVRHVAGHAKGVIPLAAGEVVALYLEGAGADGNALTVKNFSLMLRRINRLG